MSIPTSTSPKNSSKNSRSKLRVLGIDPGLERTGWAVIEKEGTSDPFLVSCGLIETKAALSFPARLEVIFNTLTRTLAQHRPDEVAMEAMSFMRHSPSISATIQARGVITLACQLAGMHIQAYEPKKVKLAITGSGAAEKLQMQRMTQLMLRLPAMLQPDDVADAAAIALCHAKMAPYQQKIQQALGKI